MTSLRERLACIGAAGAQPEFWLDLGDNHVTCGRTDERLSLAAFRLRFGSDVFTFTFDLDSAAGAHDPRD